MTFTTARLRARSCRLRARLLRCARLNRVRSLAEIVGCGSKGCLVSASCRAAWSWAVLRRLLIDAPLYHSIITNYPSLPHEASMTRIPAASSLSPRSKRKTVTYTSGSPSLPQARASTGIRASTASVTASSRPRTSSHLNFTPIINAALEAYKRKTKKDLASHPLLPKFQSCDSPEAILTVLRGRIPAFSESQNGDNQLTKWVAPVVNVLYSFSTHLRKDFRIVNIEMLSS